MLLLQHRWDNINQFFRQKIYELYIYIVIHQSIWCKFDIGDAKTGTLLPPLIIII